MCPVMLPQVSEYLHTPILVTLVHVSVPGTDSGRIRTIRKCLSRSDVAQASARTADNR